MPGRRAIRVVVAFAMVAVAAPPVDATHHDPFPPLLMSRADVTGDGVGDLLASQVRTEPPYADTALRLFDGATGRLIWSDVVTRLLHPVHDVSLGDGTRGLLIGNNVTSTADAAATSVRLRLLDRSGNVRWTRTFDAATVTTGVFPNYIRPALRGVLRAPPGSPDRVLVETSTRVEGGARRLTRLTASLLDGATGATTTEHGPFDVLDDTAALVPVTGRAVTHDFAVVRRTLDGGHVSPGEITVYDATTGGARWSTDVVTPDRPAVQETVAGAPPVPALALSSTHFDFPVQLLDLGTGAKLVDRARGGHPKLADGTGRAGVVRSRYLSEYGEANGYTVELLDLTGRPVRRRFHPVGTASTYGVVFRDIQEAGDVDGDGWHDLLFHVTFTDGDGGAADHRLVDGRTLAGVAMSPTTGALLWGEGEAGTAAVDGRGDDLFEAGAPLSRVLDGRTRRPLIEVASDWPVFGMVGVVRPRQACADVVVLSYVQSDFALTRLGPRGEVRWSTRPGSVRTRDVGGAAGCPARTAGNDVTEPPAAGPPRRPVLPATGALPLAVPAIVVAAAAVAALAASWSVPGESA